MLDDFFTRALFAGVGLALVSGPLGCFVVWRRMAYFGDTMAHSALLGAAFALFLQTNLVVCVFVVAVLISCALVVLQKQDALSTDALLGILSHSTLAIGLVMVACMGVLRFDLLGFLFGDILAVSRLDLVFIWGGGIAILVALAFLWQPLLAATVSTEIAEAEGMRPEKVHLIFMFLMAAVIAIVMKIVGILLITALLIIPAATARRFARTPESMVIMAAVVGGVAVVLGLNASLQWDVPSGPSIVVAAVVLFLFSIMRLPWRLRRINSMERR